MAAAALGGAKSVSGFLLQTFFVNLSQVLMYSVYPPQAWIDSGGELPFLKGESRKKFAERTVKAFEALNLFESDTDCALVVHGRTIMAILEVYAKPRGAYFDFQPKCGEGYILYNNGSYEQIKAI